MSNEPINREAVALLPGSLSAAERAGAWRESVKGLPRTRPLSGIL
jgi:hypothetical protein